MHLLFERRWDENRCLLILKSIKEIIKYFKSLYDFGGRCLKIKDVCMDFEPYFKVHNLVSVHRKSVILGQMTNLNMVFHMVRSVYRLVKILKLAPVPWWISERLMAWTLSLEYLSVKPRLIMKKMLILATDRGWKSAREMIMSFQFICCEDFPRTLIISHLVLLW